MRPIIKLTIFALLISTFNSYGQTFNGGRLDSLFKALEAGNQAMGSVSISHNGKMVYNKAFGFYKMAGGKSYKANTLTQYRIGSVTKVFTAVMVLQLVQEHKLSLNTPISKFFPGIPNAAKITVDELLNHTSGLHDFTADADYKTYALRPATKTDMLARVTRFRADFKPGSKTFYSNTNYLLLGYIIEQVTGKSYAANLQQRVTAKTGLQHTIYAAGKKGMGLNEASSFDFNGSGWLSIPATELSVPAGAGAMLSTPADLVQFIRSLFKLKLLNKNALAIMTPASGNLGRGLVLVPVADQLAFGHFGIVDGFKSSLLYLPQSDLAVAVCFNSANTNDNAVVDQLLNITLQQLSRNIILPAAQLSRYTGTYTSRQLPLKITIRAAGGHLVMQAGNRELLTLETLSATKFRFTKGDMLLDFSSTANNAITQLTLRQADKLYEFVKER